MRVAGITPVAPRDAAVLGGEPAKPARSALQSESETTEELLAFLNAEDIGRRDARRFVGAYPAAGHVPEQVSCGWPIVPCRSRPFERAQQFRGDFALSVAAGDVDSM